MTYTVIHEEEAGEHRYLVVQLDGDWQQEAAAEYVRLRSRTRVPLQPISLDGIDVLDVENLRWRIANAVIPARRGGNFDVLRSDLGELLCYLLLEERHQTRFGYQGLCDRETIQLPGRGIDAVGLEGGEPLTLVLGEAKVSAENASPPRVVDAADDSLRNQHLAHVNQPEVTSKKLFDLARHSNDADVQQGLLAAAVCLEEGLLDRVRIVACCLLLRPRARYLATDFGSFRNSSADFAPAAIRFFVACIDGDLEQNVNNWHAAAVAAGQNR